MNKALQTATFAGGCFWCTEAIFRRLKGVTSVMPGYSGGTVENPTYDQVSMGNTGHAEAIQIEFDPIEVSYKTLLDIFWNTHNPTTLNRQGNDEGPQYRSVIFYHDDQQHKEAEESLKEFEAEGKYSDPIVTKIEPFTRFYPAESYHKDYFEKHSGQPYCDVIISPKIHKLLELYGDKVKDEYREQ